MYSVFGTATIISRLSLTHLLADFTSVSSTMAAFLATRPIGNKKLNNTAHCTSNFLVCNLSFHQGFTKKSTSLKISPAARRDQDSTRYEVEDVSPPPQKLGLHDLPHNTHNGDTITLEVSADETTDYVVARTVFRYKYERGRYRPTEKRLEVRKTGRFLYNK